MSYQQNPNKDAMEEQYDDLEDLGLFHTSSLREPLDPPLPPVALETYELKRTYGPNNEEMYNQFEIVREIGRGAFGLVFEVKRAGEHFAMKVCSILGLEKQRFFAADGEFASSMDVLKNQLNILKRLDHKNIGKCLQIIHGNDKICTINELGTLGQIMQWRQLDDCYKRNPKVVSYISSKYNTASLGDITRIIFLQACQGVKYMHDNNITNRDIKVDNILCRQTKGMGDEIIIVDFTTVRFKGEDDISYFPVGTPGFRGPEHQFAGEEGYSCKATDVWSLGIAMWAFLHQKIPFSGQDDLQRDINSKNMELTFSEDCPPVLKDAIQKMTRKDWRERITIDQALSILQQGQ